MTQFGLAINQKRCIGCHTCSVACKQQNNEPAGVWWNKTTTEGSDIKDVPTGEFPDAELVYRTVSCQHCKNPACEAVCPTGATHKDEETGIVLVDEDTCIGCQACIEACPYEGVRTLIPEEPQFYCAEAIGGVGPKHVGNTVEKCTLCYHLTSQGGTPACVGVCPARARVFGDLDDPESEISKLIAEEGYEQWRSEAGTEPSVYFLR